jgi:hypothetical protein
MSKNPQLSFCCAAVLLSYSIVGWGVRVTRANGNLVPPPSPSVVSAPQRYQATQSQPIELASMKNFFAVLASDADDSLVLQPRIAPAVMKNLTAMRLFESALETR